MTSWKCHDITAWLETVETFSGFKVGSPKKQIKFKIYRKVHHW